MWWKDPMCFLPLLAAFIFEGLLGLIQDFGRNPILGDLISSFRVMTNDYGGGGYPGSGGDYATPPHVHAGGCGILHYVRAGGVHREHVYARAQAACASVHVHAIRSDAARRLFPSALRQPQKRRSSFRSKPAKK